MKRLAFWMVVGVAVMAFVTRHRRMEDFQAATVIYPPAHREVRVTTTTDESGRTVRTVSYTDDRPRPPVPPRPAKKAKAPRPAAPPAPAQPTPTVEAAKKGRPDWFPNDRDASANLDGKALVVGASRPDVDANGMLVLMGAISSSEEKARRDLGNRIENEVSRWLAGDVPLGWRPPAGAIDGLVRDTYVQPIVESLGDVSKDLDELVTLYRAGARLDFSRGSRARLVAIHERQVVRERMIKGGAVLGFALVALAAFSGYVRTDEATKGFYTNRLRLLAAAGVGAAGVAALHWMRA